MRKKRIASNNTEKTMAMVIKIEVAAAKSSNPRTTKSNDFADLGSGRFFSEVMIFPFISNFIALGIYTAQLLVLVF